MTTLSWKNLEDLHQLFKAMQEYDVTEFQDGEFQVKMKQKEPEPEELSAETMAELEKYSKVPTDEQLLDDPFVGLKEE